MKRPDAPASLTLVAIDLSLEDHRSALLSLLDEYARTPEGGGMPLDPGAIEHLPDLLAARSHYAGWLAFVGDHAVGLVNCFEGVSTFRARPLLNIHDIVVSADWRGRGIGRALLAAAEAGARERGCCKLTLEVLEGNGRAESVYRTFGFRPYELDPAMGRAVFLEKKLD
jgi:GNAT superfamily N-acetyltransferase